MLDKIFICDCQKVKTLDIEIAIDYILRFSLIPYKYGGDDFSGIDCSGIVGEYEKALGKIDRTADYTARQYFDMCVKLSKPQRGCLVFYGKNLSEVSHVAICLNERLCFEEGGGNQTTLTVEDAKTKNAFGRVRNIYSRKDLLGFGELV